ncbi:DUF4136 domain-containing protein [Colwelliaceae bacterium BS250]
MSKSLFKSIALVFLLASCASGYQPAVDYNPEYNFSSLKTFAVIETKLEDSQTKSLNSNISDLDNDRIIKSLKVNLLNKGMVEAEQTNADMLVRYQLVSKDKIRLRTYNSGLYNCWRCRGIYGANYQQTQVDVKQYVEGTLIIDLVDPKLQKSVWRSVVTDTLKNKEIPVEEKQAKIQDLIDQMLASFKTPTPAPAE